MRNKKLKFLTLADAVASRRGDIPITILVVGVFAICGLAIFSFYLSNTLVKNNFVSTGLIEKLGSFKEEIKFYESLGGTPSEMEIFNEGIKIGDIIFEGDKEKNSITGTWTQNNKRILFVEFTLG